MSSINPTTPAITPPTTTPSIGTTSGSGSGPASGAGASIGGTGLTKDDFLKLMVTQLQYQDPMQPADTSQYLGQLAQFTTLEQTVNMAQSTAQSAAEQHTVAALSLLGHTVSYTDSSGATLTGSVQKVDFGTSGPTLTVSGQAGINPTSVTEVT